MNAMVGLNKIEKKSLPDLFYEHIRDLILQGVLRYGDRVMPQKQLAREMGVSLTSVKRGTEKLIAQGLVEVRHGEGVYVSALPVEQELFEIRMAVECSAASLAAVRATKRDRAELQKNFDQLVANLRTQDICYRYDFRFHRAIWQASHNTLQGHLMELIDERMKQGMRAALRRIKGDPDLIEQAVEVHAQILEAIKKGDQATAGETMRVHLLFAAQGTPGVPRLTGGAAA